MTSIAEHVYNLLRTEILDGTIAAGYSLREEPIARRFATSRTPVREALRRLDAEGLVASVANRGAKVLSWAPDELREVFGLRGQLEAYAARLATPTITPEDISSLSQLADEMESLVAPLDNRSFERITVLNNKFHGIIVACTGNGRLAEHLSAIIQVSVVRNTFQLYNAEQLARSMAHHRELVAAFKARDPEWAEAVMKSHIFAARAVRLSNPDGQEAR